MGTQHKKLNKEQKRFCYNAAMQLARKIQGNAYQSKVELKGLHRVRIENETTNERMRITQLKKEQKNYV